MEAQHTKGVEQEFLSYELSKRIADLGLIENILASWTELYYPKDDESGDLRKTPAIALTIDCGNSCDEQKILCIDKEAALFHWSEGSYHRGTHSRCEFGESIPAPLLSQAVEFIRLKTGYWVSGELKRSGKYLSVIRSQKSTEYVLDDLRFYRSFDSYAEAIQSGIEYILIKEAKGGE
jgi:hypothetical protein